MSIVLGMDKLGAPCSQGPDYDDRLYKQGYMMKQLSPEQRRQGPRLDVHTCDLLRIASRNEASEALMKRPFRGCIISYSTSGSKATQSVMVVRMQQGIR